MAGFLHSHSIWKCQCNLFRRGSCLQSHVQKRQNRRYLQIYRCRRRRRNVWHRFPVPFRCYGEKHRYGLCLLWQWSLYEHRYPAFFCNTSVCGYNNNTCRYSQQRQTAKPQRSGWSNRSSSRTICCPDNICPKFQGFTYQIRESFIHTRGRFPQYYGTVSSRMAL